MPVSNLRGIGGPAVSIRTGARRTKATPTQTASNDAAGAQKTGPRNEAYTGEALAGAWDAFAAARPKMHILVNTMRASHPVAVADKPHRYTVTVENEMQRDMLQQCMHELTQWLRDSLSNDAIAIELTINTGETARHTWNDREVYARLLEEQPGIKRLADDLKLTLQ